MNILSIISVLIPSTLKVSWVFRPLYAVSLWVDGIVYSLVAYAYKLFLTMCRFNMAELLIIAKPLVNRVKALVMVVILFKIAISLIQYMLDPDKVSNENVGGSALIKRIVIVIALLISYNFIFGVLNDLSLLIIGTGDSNSLTYFESSGTDEGLITRLIFGANEDESETDAEEDESETDVEKFGNSLAVTTLQLFLQSNMASYHIFFKEVENGTKDLTGISVFSDDIGAKVHYRYPILSSVVGIYLIYSIIKVSIQVGVRMFKLIVLQLIAPVAIICYIDTKQQKVTDAFLKAYTNTYADVFIRIAAMFIATAFIGMVASSMDKFFGLTLDSDQEWYTKVLLLVIVILAAYRFALQLPKLISEIFGYNLSNEGEVSFKKAMQGVATGAAALGGAVVGGTAGLVGGGGLRGFLSGAGAGFRGKTIADKVKGVQEGVEKARNKNREIQRMGGHVEYLRAKGERALGIPQRAERKAQDYRDNNALLDNVDKARGEAIKNNEYISQYTDSSGALKTIKLKYGASRDDFAKQYAEHNQAYAIAKAKYEKRPNSLNKLEYERLYAEALTNGRNVWDKQANDVGKTDAGVQQSIRDYNSLSNNGGSYDLNTNEGIKAAREGNNEKAAEAVNNGASRRAGRTGLYGENK